MAGISSAVDSEPIVLDEDFFTDPHKLYAVLREQRPVTRAVSPLGLRVWVITRYADARAALVDPRLAKDAGQFGQLIERNMVSPTFERVKFGEVMLAHMLNSDPPDHTRLRKLVNRAFTGRAVAALRPRIEAIAGGLADAMAARVEAGEHTLDLLDAFAFPLPMTVICEILGVPDEERDDFRRWSNTVLSSSGAEERTAAAGAMAGFLNRLVEDKRANPGPDMLSEIVAASDDADRLSAVEAVSMAFLLLVAGHETTVNLIGNGMLALLRHPERFAELRADPGLTRAAVEEFLRFDGPINLATFRHTNEPVTIAGTEIPAGEIVLISLSSANRDPAQYERPDELDLHRDASHNLAFGYGIHHCLGAALARLEGEVAFRTLLERFPDMTLAAEPTELTWRVSTLIRGVVALPVQIA